jgi:hypothetical protein
MKEEKDPRTAARGQETPADKSQEKPPAFSKPRLREVPERPDLESDLPLPFFDKPPEHHQEIDAGCTACGGTIKWIARISRFAELPHYRCVQCKAVMVLDGEDIRPCELTAEHVGSGPGL